MLSVLFKGWMNGVHCLYRRNTWVVYSNNQATIPNQKFFSKVGVLTKSGSSRDENIHRTLLRTWYASVEMYMGRSKSNAFYLFPWKLQNTKKKI